MNCASPRNHAIKFLQINLRHCRLAAATFSQTLLDFDIDIALVQEPYATRDSAALPPHIPFLPDAYHALHRLDSNHHFGAAIVVKKTLRCNLVPSDSKNHVATALLEFDGSKTLYLLTLSPSLPSIPGSRSGTPTISLTTSLV